MRFQPLAVIALFHPPAQGVLILSSQKVVELKRRVNLILKGMNLMLLGEAEAVSTRERREIERRFKQYMTEKNPNSWS
jgi:hypothetical protein